MPATTPNTPAGAYWPEIQAGVSQFLTTQTFWEVLTAAHLQQTGQLPAFSFAEVTALRSIAVRNRNASIQFMKAANNVEILPEMIGRIPSAPVASPLGESRRYIVRFQHIVERDGIQVTQWRTSEFRTGILRTKSSMLNELNQQGAALAEDYENETHIGIGDVSILAA